MRWVVLLCIACVLSACNAQAFACDGNSQCSLDGEPGVCVDGNCAYPDPTCPSGYRYPAGAGSLGGSCAVGDGLGDTDSATDTAGTSTGSTASSATVVPTEGSDSSSTTQSVEPTSGESSSSSSSEDSGRTASTDTTTTGPPPSCGAQSCSGCAMCVTEADGDCSALADACFASMGCAEAVSCMIACAVDDDCTQDCCIDLDDRGIAVLLELHACSAEACAPACDLFEPPPCAGAPPSLTGEQRSW